MRFLKTIWITFSMIVILSLSFGFGLRIGPIETHFDGDSTPKIDTGEIENINQGPKTFSDKLKGILNLPQKDDYMTTLGYTISLIQISINWLLGILATIVLVYILYCGFLVLSSGSDDKTVSKGKKGILNAAIAIAGIGISWLVISVMIWFINKISEGNIY